MPLVYSKLHPALASEDANPYDELLDDHLIIPVAVCETTGQFVTLSVLPYLTHPCVDWATGNYSQMISAAFFCHMIDRPINI